MKTPTDTFRASAGIVVLNQSGEVLALQRVNDATTWQLPQGGIDIGETPRQAALRELGEETGLKKRDVDLIAEMPEWITYELPAKYRSSKIGRGQTQRYFLFRIKGNPTPKADGKEARELRWMPMSELLASCSAFRRPVYEKMWSHFQASHRLA